jgi:hypothetical protein
MGNSSPMPPSSAPSKALRRPSRKPFYRTLWGQVLVAIAVAIILGYVKPHTAVAMKPLGDASSG